MAFRIDNVLGAPLLRLPLPRIAPAPCPCAVLVVVVEEARGDDAEEHAALEVVKVRDKRLRIDNGAAAAFGTAQARRVKVLFGGQEKPLLAASVRTRSCLLCPPFLSLCLSWCRLQRLCGRIWGLLLRSSDVCTLRVIVTPLVSFLSIGVGGVAPQQRSQVGAPNIEPLRILALLIVAVLFFIAGGRLLARRFCNRGPQRFVDDRSSFEPLGAVGDDRLLPRVAPPQLPRRRGFEQLVEGRPAELKLRNNRKKGQHKVVVNIWVGLVRRRLVR